MRSLSARLSLNAARQLEVPDARVFVPFDPCLVSLSSLVLSAPRATAQSEAGAPLLAQDTVLSAPAPQPGPERVKQSLARLRIPFIANESRIDRRVSYYVSTFAGTVYVTRDGKIVYSLQAPGKQGSANRKGKSSGWSLTETLVGGEPRPRGEALMPTRVSYFIGNDPARWKTSLPTFDSVSLGEVWPGVELSLRAYGNNVEKLFTVEPGADPSRIRMRVAGARSLRVDEHGALVVKTDVGDVTFTCPVAYQEKDGVRRDVAVAYLAKGRRYGFLVGGHDPTLPMVIDPLLQATYLGGSDDEFGLGFGGDDSGSSVAIDPTTGDVLVAGTTGSVDFPGTAGGAQPATAAAGRLRRSFNASLTTLIQATYLGGSGARLRVVLGHRTDLR